MTTTTLVLPHSISEELHRTARMDVESAAVLLVSMVEASDGGVRLLARKLCWVAPDSYIRRERDRLSIPSDGYVPFLSEAERIGAIPIWVHTHPGLGADPRASTHDHEVDRQISDLFRLRSGSPYYGAVIFSPRLGGLAFTGYVQKDDGDQIPIGRLWEVGERFRFTSSFETPSAALPQIFDRQVRAFGGAVQQTLSELHVGVVGCGGTGSSVVEQMVRLGVRHLTLIDPDRLSGSNVTRVYGSSPDDIGRFKVDVLSDHVRRIAPDARCTGFRSMLTEVATARELCGCDIIFGCTDDNAGRLVLSRVPTYLLVPVIDCGVLLSSDEQGQLVGVDGRITTIVPEGACLLCRGRIDVARAAAEMLTPAERKKREDEGYAPALGRTEPAVVTFTTFVAAAAASELLERLVGYGPTPAPTEVLLRCHEREISTNMACPRLGHYCHPESGKIGMGMTEPFLEQIWAA